MGGQANTIDLHPMLSEKTTFHVIDLHYFYQAVWAFKCISSTNPVLHFDIASQAIFVGMLTAITRVKFIDLRPLNVSLENYEEERGSVIQLPMENSSVDSLSCLHVAEHIGLGRYGDPLDPDGTIKTANELNRVLAEGGNLFFSVPIGRPRNEFNAHRVHDTSQVLEMFPNLDLKEFSIVTDDGVFHQGMNTKGWDHQNYACGMFWFFKPARRMINA